MAFNFNHFFGYEDVINRNPDLVLIYGFGVIIFGMMLLTLLSMILVKIGITVLVDHFLAPLTLSLLLCLIVAIIPTVILKVVANDLSGVKLVYIWITIFAGTTFFSFSNYPMMKKWSAAKKG